MSELTMPPEEIEPSVDEEVDAPTFAPLDEAEAAVVFATEQEVVLSTAVALGHLTQRRSRTASVVAAVRRAFSASSGAARRERRRYPARHAFYEDSRLEREMHRL